MLTAADIRWARRKKTCEGWTFEGLARHFQINRGWSITALDIKRAFSRARQAERNTHRHDAYAAQRRREGRAERNAKIAAAVAEGVPATLVAYHFDLSEDCVRKIARQHNGAQTQ